MTCGEAREYLFAFLDGELDAALSIEHQRHLEHCPVCAREAEIERSIRRQLVTVFDRSDDAVSDKDLKQMLARVRWGRRRHRLIPLGLLGMAAVLALAWVGRFAFLSAQKPEPSLRFPSLLVADFEHFLEAGKSLQLKSSDPLEASRWLQERTQVAVVFPVMPHERCKLVGARACKVSGRPAAFAFYEIDGEPASLVALSGSEEDLGDMQRVTADGRAHWVEHCKGHTVVACKHDGLVYAAVSRLDESRLLELMPGAVPHGGRP